MIVSNIFFFVQCKLVMMYFFQHFIRNVWILCHIMLFLLFYFICNVWMLYKREKKKKKKKKKLRGGGV
jgi:Na+-driven multidrug efflux pump